MKEKKIIALALLGLSGQLEAIRPNMFLRDNNPNVVGHDAALQMQTVNDTTDAPVVPPMNQPSTRMRLRQNNQSRPNPSQREHKAPADQKGHEIDSFMRENDRSMARPKPKSPRKYYEDGMGGDLTPEQMREKRMRQDEMRKKKMAEERAHEKRMAAAQQKKMDQAKDAAGKQSLSRNEKSIRALDTKFAKLEKKEKKHQQKLDDLERQDDPVLRRGQFANAKKDEERDHLEAIAAEKGRIIARREKLTQEYKDGLADDAAAKLEFHTSTDHVIEHKLKTLREKKADLQELRHKALQQDKELHAVLKDDTAEYNQKLLDLRDAKNRRDKAEIARLEDKLSMRHGKVEQLDRAIKKLDRELAKYGAQKRDNDSNYDKAAKTLGKPSMEQVRADRRLTQAARNGQPASQIFSGYDKQLRDRADEVGVERPNAVRALPEK